MSKENKRPKSLYELKLERRKKKSKKDTIVTDMDYVMRDKEDSKDSKNTHNMTPEGVKPGGYEAKHAKEIEALKAAVLAANAEKQPADNAQADEIAELKAQVAALVEASKDKPKAPATKAK